MNHFRYVGGALHCEDVPLSAIAAAVGTPVYVYSTATLERHFRVFREAFAPMEPLVAYAVKANPNVAVIATLARLGAGADTVSAGEVARALAAGVPPEKIVFSGVGKTHAEIAFALEKGVHQLNVESAAELDMVEAVAQRLGIKARAALRVNPEVGAGGHDKITTGGATAKFGVGLHEVEALYARIAGSEALDPGGLAVHIGSQIRDLDPLERAFRALLALADRLKAAGLPVPRLDLGGGLGAPYFHEPDPPAPSAYASMVRRVFAGAGYALAFEPGRVIAANAGALIATVLRRQERPNRSMLVLDAGMNDLLRPAMYESHHDLWPVAEPQAARETVDLVGPVCESSDTFARARTLPPLRSGDLVAFMTAGAYGASMSSTYNARDLVPEVLVRGDRFEVVRRRWTAAEQMALERTPDWLPGF